jgi:4-hydroxybenzoate polyprenyltransferase
VVLSQQFAYIYLWIFLALSVVIGCFLFRENRERFRAAASFAFPSRSLHYLLLLAFGFLYAAQAGGVYGRLLNAADVSKLAMALVSIFLLFVHAKIANDRHDLAIDRISNPDRPLVSGILSGNDAGSLGALAWGAGFVAALMTAKIFICCWLALWAAAHLYSAPPFRLRRFYPAGHLTLAAIGTLVFLTGTMLALGDGAYNRIAEKAIFIYVFLAFFCLCHLKDFKDMEGDRAVGVCNILARLRWPRLAGVAAIWGYCLFVGLIAERLRLNLLPAVVLFGTACAAYVLRVQEPARIDRLIPLSLLLLSALAIAFFAAYGFL